ncbi:MAG: hypothetical protein ACTHOH_01770 [Lysobacteraceae bacterium]
MEPSRAPFAFRLAEVREDVRADAPQSPQWQIRDGVVVAGCTGTSERTSRYPGTDNSYYC